MKESCRHPGGYTAGSKTMYNQTAFVNASSALNADGIVFVALNYRLGAFGWLAGPTVEAETTPQPALLDQRLALQWVQDYIHLFGGDRRRVTVMGYSAGAGSIVHHLTAFGGRDGPPLFHRAIVQSPGIAPLSPEHQEQTYTEFLAQLSASSLDAARQLSSDALIAANAAVSRDKPYGTIAFGPVPDGNLVPGPASRLLAQGYFRHDVEVLTTHTSNEGLRFADPRVKDDASYKAWLRRFLPSLSVKAFDYIAQTLYPSILNGTEPYRTPLQRAALTATEANFACYTEHIGRAYSDRAYKYEFAVPNATHLSDLAYIFWDGNQTSVPYPDAARAVQQYILSFVISGKPAAAGYPSLEPYAGNARIVRLNGPSAEIAKDPLANQRCEWWQKGLLN